LEKKGNGTSLIKEGSNSLRDRTKMPNARKKLKTPSLRRTQDGTRRRARKVGDIEGGLVKKTTRGEREDI